MAADRISVHLGKTSWPPGSGGHSRTNPGTSRQWLGTVQAGTVVCMARAPCAPRAC